MPRALNLVGTVFVVFYGASCSSRESSPCSSGTLVRSGDAEYCGHPAGLVIEGGFDCPPEMPVRIELDEAVVCVDRATGSVPEDVCAALDLPADCGGDSSAPFDVNPMLGLVETACATMLDCFPGVIDLESCEDAVLALNNWADDFGLPSEPARTGLEVIAGIEEGSIGVRASALGDCTDAMETLTCETVATAYDPESPLDMSRLETVVPSACDDVFFEVVID